MDGVTLVFNKTYYWEAAEIEYLCSNESSNLASNSNGLELRDRRHRSGNDMSERHQGVDESFWFVSNEWDSRKKGHWLRGMRRGRVLCATSFVCLGKTIYVHTLRSVEKRFFQTVVFMHVICVEPASLAGSSSSKPLRRALWLQQQRCRIGAWWQRFVW